MIFYVNPDNVVFLCQQVLKFTCCPELRFFLLSAFSKANTFVQNFRLSFNYRSQAAETVCRARHLESHFDWNKPQKAPQVSAPFPESHDPQKGGSPRREDYERACTWFSGVASRESKAVSTLRAYANFMVILKSHQRLPELHSSCSSVARVLQHAHLSLCTILSVEISWNGFILTGIL